MHRENAVLSQIVLDLQLQVEQNTCSKFVEVSVFEVTKTMLQELGLQAERCVFSGKSGVFLHTQKSQTLNTELA